MRFDDEFAGKGVVITGAAGIFGRALAAAFAAEGARLCLTDREAADLAPLADLPGQAPGSFIHAADMRRDSAVASLAEAVAARWGAADIVINNAGIYPSAFLLDMDADDWDRIFDVNLRAPFLLTRAFALQMIGAERGGVILNISSGAARKMRRTAVAYSTSKTALDRLTKGFALELAEYGIRVNAIEPGFAPGSTVSALSPDHVAQVAAAIPLGRPSRPEDVGQAALYLCSAAAGYVTGATLAVDGGNSIGSMAVYQAKRQAL